MFKNRSKLLFINVILLLLYLLCFYLVFNYIIAIDNSDLEVEDQLASSLSIVFIFIFSIPHLISIIITILLSVVGFTSKKTGVILAMAIFCTITTVLSIPLISFVIPTLYLLICSIISYIAFNKQKKINLIKENNFEKEL